MKTPNLDRRLKNHDRLCKMNEFNLGADRYCSCGRDAAIEELKSLIESLIDIIERLENGTVSLK